VVVPTEWKEVRLGDHCDANWGNTTITKSSYVDSGVTAFSASGPDGFVSWHEHNGDGLVLSAIGALCGKTWLAQGRWTPIKNTIWIKSKSSNCSTRYVYHATSNPEVWPSRGAAQPFIALGDVRVLKVLLPPLKEQEAIAEALSDADSAIESLDALIAKKRDVKQATMQQLLTGRTRLPGFNADWKEVSLGEHAAFFKGNGLSKSQLIDDGPQQCVHYGELFTHYGPVIETVTSKCVAFEGSFKSMVGDVLMPGSDVTPRGLATASAIKVSDVVLGGDVIVIRTKPTSLYGPFLSNFIRMSKGRVLRLVKGSTVYHIHAKDLADLEVLMPPLKEQEAIAETITGMDDELEALTAQVSKLRMVKEGMMQDLLTGKVRLV
jgi:type I restriction enzyme S subunit